MSKRCPKCHSNQLEEVNRPMVNFQCNAPWCRQSFNKQDYIEWTLKNYYHKIDMDKILKLCMEGVERV